jgi:hypothetical protein
MENPLPEIRPQPTVDPPPLRIALTGATGYVGGRLAPRLLAAGHSVRCLVRDVRKLDGRAWRREPGLEVVACDFLDPVALRAALEGCDVAYYLIHSMESRVPGSPRWTSGSPRGSGRPAPPLEWRGSSTSAASASWGRG